MAVNKLTTDEKVELLALLEDRFEKNSARHESLDWAPIQAKLEKNEDACWTLSEMERTGGEPDVTHYDEVNDLYTFTDCSAESPKGRRSLCYDRAALEARKKFKPENSAIDMAREIGISILTEEEYRSLQENGAYDLKTSSWIQTPDSIREKGGALFCDRRYDTVFLYHNGAESYYAARGFRGSLNI